VSAEDIATVISAVGDSWPAALVLIFGAAAFVTWKALPLLRDIKSKTDDVHHEMYNNSGSSLRDAVDRIEQGGKETKEALAAHLEASAAVWARVAELEARHSDGE
jgi:hypothetical protein